MAEITATTKKTSSTLIASGMCPQHVSTAWVTLFLSRGVGKVLLLRHNRSRLRLSTLRLTPSLVNFVPF